MKQSRRDFLKTLPLALSVPFSLGGIPVRVMADNSLTRMAAGSDNDRVLIILQMHGGNDGLNALIPVDQYELYYSKRSNIAIPAQNRTRGYIPLDSTQPLEQQVGLHPDMQSMKAMYDQGYVSVVQGVSYKKNNGSHFRGRDIWFMGGSADEYLQSGWVGRYLQSEYAPLTYPENFPLVKGQDPNDPNNEMLDPLAIEMGNDLSLIFHQQGNIPTSIAFTDAAAFAELVGGLEGFVDEQIDPRGLPPPHLQGSPYYKELDWILSLEDKTKDYAARLGEVYNRGKDMQGFSAYPTTYPYNAPQGSLHNSLSWQLQIVAKLLSGGCKTKVFLVKIGGFDTHAGQVETYDSTMGGHAALLYHITSAMQAFQQDLRIRGLEDRVLTLTTSEFGRRISSNGSYGTDHGTAGPMFIFGKGVKPGIHGEAFKVTNNGAGDNLEMQHDYRVVYANIMRDWMLVDDARLDKIFPNTTDPSKGIMTGGTSDGENFSELPIASQTIVSADGFIGERFAMEDIFPNPAKENITIKFRINSTNFVNLNIFDHQGKKIRTVAEKVFHPGAHELRVDVSAFTEGMYICELKCGFFKDSKKLAIVK
jgi:uncharacterized protein (DUF1501 family)